jgi:hypothetical protein
MSSDAPSPTVHPTSSTSTAQPTTELTKPAKQQQGQKKEKKEKKPAQGGNVKLELDPKPEFFDSRNEIFDKYKKIYEDKVACEFYVLISIL